MAGAVGISPSSVGRIWAEAALKLYLVRRFKVSNNPMFEEKVTEIVGLYLDPPERSGAETGQPHHRFATAAPRVFGDNLKFLRTRAGSDPFWRVSKNGIAMQPPSKAHLSFPC